MHEGSSKLSQWLTQTRNMVPSPGLSPSDLVRLWSVSFRVIMVSSVGALMVLMVTQVFFGGSRGLVPQIGRSSLSQDVLHAFELRLLSMFGLKHRPSPSRSAVVPQYMMDLYSMHSVNAEQNNSNRPKGSLGKGSERSASRANTIRSFHHDGKQVFTSRILPLLLHEIPSFHSYLLYPSCLAGVDIIYRLFIEELPVYLYKVPCWEHAYIYVIYICICVYNILYTCTYSDTYIV